MMSEAKKEPRRAPRNGRPTAGVLSLLAFGQYPASSHDRRSDCQNVTRMSLSPFRRARKRAGGHGPPEWAPTMQFILHDLGRQKRGAVAVVRLSGNSANVQLMDQSNLQSYKNRKNYRYFGGYATKSPVRLTIPSDGHWYVAVDLGGRKGSVRSGVSIERGPLLPLRTSAQPSLDMIRHEAPPSADVDDGREWDVFISHASEDKADVALPLAEALKEIGVTVWLDKIELKIGDSLRRKIDAGLASSRFGIVVLSERFFLKGWTQYELDGLVTRYVNGEQNILPIWHNMTAAQVRAKSPSLADKIAVSTADFTIIDIAAQIASVVRPDLFEDDEE